MHLERTLITLGGLALALVLATGPDARADDTTPAPQAPPAVDQQARPPEPTATPPSPPANPPAPQVQPQAQPAPQPTATGQWVYTDQYGWVWIPYADNYTYIAPDGSYAYAYVYYPAIGWTWVLAPWIFGWGPHPYWGRYGLGHYGWHAHPWFHVGRRWRPRVWGGRIHQGRIVEIPRGRPVFRGRRDADRDDVRVFRRSAGGYGHWPRGHAPGGRHYGGGHRGGRHR